MDYPKNNITPIRGEIHLKMLVCTTTLYLSAGVSKVGLVSREHRHEKVGCKTQPSLWWGDSSPLIPDVPPPRKNRVLPPLPVNSVDELCDERVLQELEELKCKSLNVQNTQPALSVTVSRDI